MARPKIAIENARDRAATYARRTKGLHKMAKDLSTLCAVPVALVCAPAAGDAGTRLVWESEAGVLDRYRGAAVTRVRHTHRSYLEAELGKKTAKLARARSGALVDWDPAFNDMKLDEAREVLNTIDAVLRAAGDRMAAMGLPAEGHLDELQVALAPGDDDASNDATAVPQQLELENMGNAGFQMQMVSCHGGNNDSDLLEQLLWDDRFPMQPGYGLECVGGNYDVGAIDETQAPAAYVDNTDCSWPNLTMFYADDGSRDAVLPAGYYYPKFVDGTLAPEHYSSQVVTGEDYALPLDYPMGMDENFTNLDNSYTMQWQGEEFQGSDTNSSMDENYTYLDNTYAAQWQAEEFQLSDTTNSSMDENFTNLDNTYAAQWQAEEFQLSDTNSSMDENCIYLDNSYAAHWQTKGTGHYQHQCSDPGTSSSSQAFSLSLLDQWCKS